MTWFRAGGGGGEDVSKEVAIQTPLIQQIREMIVGKATDANATEDTIVKGYSAYVGQKLVNGGYIANGAHIWREFTEKDGILIRNVSSDDESAYPVDGEKDGKYYKKVFEGAAGIDFGQVTVSNKDTVTIEHNLGVIPSRAVIMPLSISTSGMMLQFVSKTQYNSSGSARSLIEVYDSSQIETFNGIYNFTDKSVTFSVNNRNFSYFNGTFMWTVFA